MKRLFAVLVTLITIIPEWIIRKANHPIWVLYWILGVCSVGLTIGIAMGVVAIYRKFSDRETRTSL